MDIKQVIKDFVSFDVVNDYYNKEEKEEIVSLFKQILYEDDVTVRKFLEKFFDSTKEVANNFGLIAKSGEVSSDEDDNINDEEEVSSDEDTFEDEEQSEKNTREESRKRYISAAASILYE